MGNSAVGYDLFLSSSNNVISSSKISSSLIAGNQAEGVLISENSDNNTVRSSQVLNDSLNGVDVYPGVTGPASSPTRSTATAAGSSCGPEPPGAPSRATPRRTTPSSTWRTTTAPPVTRTSGCTTTSIPPTSHASTEICTASPVISTAPSAAKSFALLIARVRRRARSPSWTRSDYGAGAHEKAIASASTRSCGSVTRRATVRVARAGTTTASGRQTSA